MKKFLAGLLGLSAALQVLGQDTDTLQSKELEAIVVTGTRTERMMGALPMPITLIPKHQIRTMGSLRLNDVLAEQTGLAIVPQVNGSGNGIQIQGFNPDYTLILIDGEPLIGRFTGSLELSRLTVGNIKQIELVKGPSSSLYGSDALAGVINIITERPQETKGNFSARYGANQTMDLSANYSRSLGRVGVSGFLNRYSTDGYDLTPENYGKTVSPSTNYTGTAKLTWKIADKTDLSLAGRYFTEHQQFDYEVLTATQEKIRTSGIGKSDEWNLNPVLTHRFNEHLKMTARLYQTSFKTATQLNNVAVDTLYYTDDFQQTFLRPEVNAEFYFSDRSILTVGAGEIFETVQTSRYGDETERRQQTRYIFAQEEWSPMKRLNIIVGGRFDHNDVYGSQFSPKFSSSYDLSTNVVLKGSFGVGFKAPDFRQLYFNFKNSAGGGYSVLGTEVVGDQLNLLEQEGQIQAYLLDPSSIGTLSAERSVAINVGGKITWPGQLITHVNVFYNSIDNLIETQAVAITTANQTIYSYRNIKRAYTEGLELNFTYPLSRHLNLAWGYQLLFAKDKDVAAEVSNGNVFWRDPETLVTKRLTPSEYFGLYNRSRHMANVKFFYADLKRGWEGSVRVIYRGPYGIGDIRGSIQGEVVPPSDINYNGILDVHDSFIGNYALVNLSVAKTFGALRLQVGVDNLFNYTDHIYIPNLPGRLIYTSLGYSINPKSK